MNLSFSKISIQKVPARQTVIALRFQQVSRHHTQRLRRTNNNRSRGKRQRLFLVRACQRNRGVSLKWPSSLLHVPDHETLHVGCQRLGQLFDRNPVLKQLLDHHTSPLLAAEQISARGRDTPLRSEES